MSTDPTQHPGQAVDLDEVRRLYDEDDECVDFHAPAIEVASWVPALVADLDAAREALRRVEEERDYRDVQLADAAGVGRRLIRERDDTRRERDEFHSRSEKWRHDFAILRIERDRWERLSGEAEAERDRMRQELTNVGWSSVADLHAAYLDVLDRWQRSEPVLAAARAWARSDGHGPRLAAARAWARSDGHGPRLAAAVDTYETGGTE